MDIDRIIEAFSTLYAQVLFMLFSISIQSESLDDVNSAQGYIDGIVNDSSIVIDLEGGLEKGNDSVVFGLCNIIYQQVLIVVLVLLYRLNYSEEHPT